MDTRTAAAALSLHLPTDRAASCAVYLADRRLLPELMTWLDALVVYEEDGALTDDVLDAAATEHGRDQLELVADAMLPGASESLIELMCDLLGEVCFEATGPSVVVELTRAECASLMAGPSMIAAASHQGIRS